MIANLITTILLALGVATGNVSSNSYKSGNAFNHELVEHEKPQPKKAIEQTTLIETTNIRQTQWTQLGTNQYNQKYYLGTNNSPTIYNQYVNIYNTIYYCNEKDNNNWAYGYYVMIFNLTNYTRNTLNNVTLNQTIKIYNSTNRQLTFNKYTKLWNQNNVTDSYIDINLTSQNTAHLIYTELANYTENEIDTVTDTHTATATATAEYYYWEEPFSYTIDYLEAMTTTTIAMMFRVAAQLDSEPTSQIYLGMTNETDYTHFKITAYLVNQVEVNQEVIDVPNLMFTIITLPFAWYSTAFNLTIFPNTPYQLNFGNLVMTIVAAMILLYLIRKIIK